MHTEKLTILGQNFGKSPVYLFLDIQLPFYSLIRNYSLKGDYNYELIFPFDPNFKAFPTKTLRLFKNFKTFFNVSTFSSGMYELCNDFDDELNRNIRQSWHIYQTSERLLNCSLFCLNVENCEAKHDLWEF